MPEPTLINYDVKVTVDIGGFRIKEVDLDCLNSYMEYKKGKILVDSNDSNLYYLTFPDSKTSPSLRQILFLEFVNGYTCGRVKEMERNRKDIQKQNERLKEIFNKL